jgi:hypothetical protein
MNFCYSKETKLERDAAAHFYYKESLVEKESAVILVLSKSALNLK